jgi:hypothetical protein
LTHVKAAEVTVGRSPWCHPPGTLDALKSHRRVLSPEPVASTSTKVASRQPAARIEPSAEDMRRAHLRRLARLRAHAPQSASERALCAHAPQNALEPERAARLRVHAPQSASRAIERATPAQHKQGVAVFTAPDQGKRDETRELLLRSTDGSRKASRVRSWPVVLQKSLKPEP